MVDRSSVQSLIKCLLVLSILARTALVSGSSNLWDFPLHDYDDHVCDRPCQDNAPPRLCHYDLVVEHYYVMSKACYDCPNTPSHCLLPQCVSAGGVRRVITTANRILPGPRIVVCENDTIEVKVSNMMDGGGGTTIHWHGLLQRGTPYMDGTSMVTQCPLLAGSHFTYRFTAMDVGTYFWHGHAGTQRADGLFGALIVRQPPSRDPHYSLYDYDLAEHVMVIHDWLTVVSTDRLAELVHWKENLHMTILINGKGKFMAFNNETSNMTSYTPRAVFTVMPGMRYRFRVIDSGILNCPLEISIDNHTLTVIASDGSPVQPVKRSSFTLFAGERYDFVLTAKNTSNPSNYWIRVRGHNSCTMYNISQTAILKYMGAPDELPPEPNMWEAVVADEDDDDSTNNSRSNLPILEQLVSLMPDQSVVLGEPDHKIFIDVDMVDVQNLRSYNPPYYTLESSELFQSPQLNYITSLLPPAPPLTQWDDLPKEIFCNAETVQQNCQAEWCVCVHLIELQLGSVVELILLDDDAYHPMHLHGHKYRVVGYGKLEDGTPFEDLKAMDAKGLLKRRATADAPLKDTATAPVGGYSILRFRADNPGFWLFHCHIEFHTETGMLLIFQVGNSSQMPAPPKRFPTCGSFDFQGLVEPPTSTAMPQSPCVCNVTCNIEYHQNMSNICGDMMGDNGDGGGNSSPDHRVQYGVVAVVSSLMVTLSYFISG